MNHSYNLRVVKGVANISDIYSCFINPTKFLTIIAVSNKSVQLKSGRLVG